MEHWDDVIEEAAGELEGIEGQLLGASKQLVDLRTATARLTADAQTASAARDQVQLHLPILNILGSHNYKLVRHQCKTVFCVRLAGKLQSCSCRHSSPCSGGGRVLSLSAAVSLLSAARGVGVAAEHRRSSSSGR